jgi:hypothetical protein
VDDAVPDNVNLRWTGNGPGITLPERTEQMLDGRDARDDIRALAPYYSPRISYGDLSNAGIPLDFAFPQTSRSVDRNGVADFI